MTALKEIHKREDKRWVIYTELQSSMQAIEYSKENHAILNQIYDILTAKQAIDMPEMTLTLLYRLLPNYQEGQRLQVVKRILKQY